MTNILKNEFDFPIERSYPKYESKASTWSGLSTQEIDSIKKNKLQDSQKVVELFMLSEIWDLQLINNEETSFLVESKYFKDKSGHEVHNYLSFYEKSEDFYNEDSSVRVYISYPFHKYYEQTIYPIIQTSYAESIKKSSVLPIGYIA